MTVMRLIHTAVTLLVLVIPSAALFKRWISNTDFDNPRNWDAGHLPCPNDRIIFPESSPVVAINQDWTLKELVLPNDGIFILGDNINLVFNDNPTISDQCQTPSDIRYNYTLASHWLDPTKWCLPQHDYDAICFENILQLHTEMIPCATDDVMFSGLLRESHRSSFYVNLDISDDMEIGTLRIGQEIFTTQGFQEYIKQSKIGQREFVKGAGLNPPILNITNRICVDPAGCYCGTNESPWRQKICSYVGACPPVNCPNPVTPDGHCCSICGSRLMFSINATVYNEFEIKEMIKKEFVENKNIDYADVRYVVSRQVNGDSQVTLVDAGNGQKSSDVAAQFKAKIDNDPNFATHHGIQAVTKIETSHNPNPITSTTTSTGITTKTSTTSRSTSTSTRTSTGTPTVTSGTTKVSSSQPASSTSTKSPQTTTKPATTSSTETTNPPVTAASSSKTSPAVTEAAQTTKQPGAGEKARQTVEETAAVTMSSGLIIGIVMLGVLLALLTLMALACFLLRRRESSDPLAVSIKFDEGGSDGAVVLGGLENPTFDYSLDDDNAIPLSNMGGTNGVSNVSASTKRKQKKVSQKKSNGFENPVFFDAKTTTLGPVGGATGSNGPGIDNPLYSDSDLDPQPDGSKVYDDF